MSWLRTSNPREDLEAQLLAQWRRSRSQVNFELLPLRLLQSYLSHSSEETAEAKNDKTAWCQDRPKPLKRIVRKMLSASVRSVKRSANWLNRRRCLQPLRVALVNLGRRLMVKGLVFLTQSLRRFLGTRTCSKSSPMNSLTQQKPSA